MQMRVICSISLESPFHTFRDIKSRKSVPKILQDLSPEKRSHKRNFVSNLDLFFFRKCSFQVPRGYDLDSLVVSEVDPIPLCLNLLV